TLRELGATVDLAATASEAAAIGRRGGPLAQAQELWSLWREGGYDVAPRMQIDSAKLQQYLNSIAQEIERPPRNAALSVAAGKVIPTPGQPGRQLLADDTAREVMRALLTLSPQTVALRTRLLEPTLGDAGIAGAVQDAQALLKRPLVLTQGTQRWTWQPDRIAELLAVRAEGSTMTISPDPERLARAVDDLAQLVDSGSAEPRLAWQNGAVAIAQEGTAGWQLQQPEAVQAISETLWLEQRTLPLPVEELQPQVTAASLPELGIVELVSEGNTSFAGSAAYRVTNIKAGAARMDGVLIPPDAEFSFNAQLGEVDEANGFVQGYAVIGNRTQLEWGGGVCQDSTTLFRAAFWAGLPITERHPHPFYISWYDDYAFPDAAGPGMDAAIYTGVSDLKFVNDTGNWLLLEAAVDEANAVLSMRLYGTKPNREVTVIGPEITGIIAPPSEPRIINDASVAAGTFKQTDTARRGMDIAVYRVISENGEEREPELFYTRFKAWPNVFVRGTGG
ncbi:MAG: VanW family protein, partial [Chloroflexales bacterium]|nr:VanW family protein [Chloroflexales bacterium]